MFNIVEADDFDPIRYKRYEDDIYRTGDYLLVLNLYESDGSFVKPVCNFSVIYGFGEVGFMAEVEGRFGTLFTNQGFSTGDKVEYITTVASTSKLSELSDYLYAPITTKSIAKPSPSVLTFTYDGFGHAPNIPESIKTSQMQRLDGTGTDRHCLNKVSISTSMTIFQSETIVQIS